ncbi:MAG: 50S ribosomal protein L20 [Verrucomicrobiota bacterium]|nr:50S ribosomal protein L20 [Verrucomicrobiota bacterium]
MPRSRNTVASRKRRKRLLKEVRGFYGRRKLLRTAHDAHDKAMQHAYIGRKQKKRQYRRLWNIRINAACRELGMNYSTFINGLRRSDISLNRKVLADMAVNDEKAFAQLVETAKKAIATS